MEVTGNSLRQAGVLHPSNKAKNVLGMKRELNHSTNLFWDQNLSISAFFVQQTKRRDMKTG